jgi:pyruvate dehydrogenase E2 component (dihydrolipoamide acetyltransferase)
VIEFKLPELGENISQGDLVRLMIAPGATVSAGQSVMELETDKAVLEVPSSVSGTVQEIRVKQGDKVKVGQVIFTVENGAGLKSAAAPAAEASPAGKNETQAEAPGLVKTETPAPQAKTQSEPKPAAPSSEAAARVPVERVDRRAQPQAREFRLPELGENISQGDLVRLMIAPGAKVSEGQPVMELETDKAVIEVPSSVSGVVKEVKVKQGEKIKVGQVIFTLEGGAPAQSEPVPSRNAPVHFRLRFALKVKRKNRRCLPTSRSGRRTPSRCLRNSVKLRARSIAIRFPQRRMCGGWRAKLASTFMK